MALHWGLREGGYIFFVISGYLITGMILEKKHFSIGEFYSKRVRRLVPALLVTIIATFVAGAVLLFPQDFRTLSQSALYAFGRNIERLFLVTG